MEQYLSIAILAKLTQLSESYWRKAIHRKLLSSVRIGGGRTVRVKLADAERFLAAGTRAAREVQREGRNE